MKERLPLTNNVVVDQNAALGLIDVECGDPDLTPEQARVKAMEADPELRKRYAAERS